MASTPTTPKPSAVSSRLLSMKFMQRAAATEPPTSSSTESSSAKRRKLAHHPSPSPSGAHPSDDPFSNENVRAAMVEVESKRAAAVERRAAELEEARWIIDAPALSGKGKRPLNVVYVGYGDIDRAGGEAEGEVDGEEGEAAEGREDKVQSGRRVTGNYRRKEDKANENKGTGSDSDTDDSDDDDESDSDGTPRRPRSAKKERIGQAQDKRKAEVKLSRLVSISSGGALPGGGSTKSMKCYGCGGMGHKATSAECPKNKKGGASAGARKRHAN
ncbi:uncharacterized protein DNG_05407 [Cephalotrichum gorgonifer]|uniref:CCHC-type domain-containing protein n=1 Tax=Cephalotrichum gorgonifer TaxID=2041049 RepID=A0AAE8SW83_9PEZI|nr:uncharacterized protein DNG_05407 [Cephalotrichum gorgonifer]